MSGVASKRPREFAEAVVRLVKEVIGVESDLFDLEKSTVKMINATVD